MAEKGLEAAMRRMPLAHMRLDYRVTGIEHQTRIVTVLLRAVSLEAGASPLTNPKPLQLEARGHQVDL